MEVPDGNVVTVMRYLTTNATCRLHPQLRTFIQNRNGVELSNIKFKGISYTVTNETVIIEKKLTFNAEWCSTQKFFQLKTLAEDRICQIECKIIHIGQLETFAVTSVFKKTQKLRKEIIVGDDFAAIILNIYETHFNLIETSISCKISGLKPRLYKDTI